LNRGDAETQRDLFEFLFLRVSAPRRFYYFVFLDSSGNRGLARVAPATPGVWAGCQLSVVRCQLLGQWSFGQLLGGHEASDSKASVRRQKLTARTSADELVLQRSGSRRRDAERVVPSFSIILCVSASPRFNSLRALRSLPRPQFPGHTGSLSRSSHLPGPRFS